MNVERFGGVRDWLAFLVVVGGGLLLREGDGDLRMVVASMVTMVLSYFFGSSQSNTANRETINKMIDVQTDAAKALAEKVPVAPTAPTEVKVVNEPVDVKVVASADRQIPKDYPENQP